MVTLAGTVVNTDCLHLISLACLQPLLELPFETVYGIFEKLVERCNKKTRKVGEKNRSAPEGEKCYAYPYPYP